MTTDTSAWNEPQLDPLSPPPDDFSDMSVEDAAQLIKEWFFDNFEDPVHNTPHDSGEGGYQYIWGGPYEADDVIANVFADVASDEIIKAAIDAVELEGSEWAPNSRRIQPPGDEERPGQADPDTKALHARMLEQIAALEEALERLSSPGIGHNRPPEPLAAEPLSTADHQAMTAAISVLKAQPVEPAETPIEAVNAVNLLHSIGAKISSYLADKGNLFVTEAVKSAGVETGKWAVRLPLWALLAKALLDAVNAVGDWLHAVHPPF